ncbi:hypothetical protein KA977_14155 [Candidatus Dependentiae bacterium]|nr:hypothetical protein [Candidatus Dependentiae bacterium]
MKLFLSEFIICFFLLTSVFFNVIFSQNIKLGFMYEKSENYSHLLNPLVYIYNADNEKNILFSRKFSGKNENKIEVLYPLYSYINNYYKTESQLLGIFNITKYKNHPDGEDDSDYIFFPAAMAGKDKKKWSYFCLFPLAGNLKGKLGKDEISFVLFPFYMKTVYKNIFVKHYLYPFIANGYSDNEKNYSYKKIFPFYSEEKYKNKTSKNFLWPFYNFEEIIESDGTVFKSFNIFPFYGIENNKNGKYISYFYPLIKYKQNNHKEYFSVFPFYEHIRDKNFFKENYFFLYGKTVFFEKNIKKKYYLFPIITEYKDDRSNIYRLNIIPFYKKYRDMENEIFQVFPIVKIKKKYGKTTGLHLFAFDMFLRETSVEKNYARFWRLFNYTNENKLIKFDGFYKTISYVKNDESMKLSVFPLFT